MITANDCYCSAYQLSNSTITVFHWNDDSNDTLFSSYLLGALYLRIISGQDRKTTGARTPQHPPSLAPLKIEYIFEHHAQL